MSSERERRRVSFRGSPPSGSSSRNPSDSGVGSLSGSDQGSTRADRSSTARDVQGQWDNLPALQEAYRALHEAKEHWKSKARQLDDELSATRKSAKEATKEVEQKYRTILQHNEDLENDKAKIFKEKKSLAATLVKRDDEIQELRHLLADANASVEKLRRNSPPLMSGANPSHHHHHSSSTKAAAATAEPSSSRPQRSSSKRGESSKEQKQRLEKRFEQQHSSSSNKEADVRSDSTAGSSSKSSRSTRRSSYIEPFGPAAPSTAATTAASSRQMPPPPPPPPAVTGYANYPTYTQATQGAPVIAQTQEPTYSAVPRSVRPHVTLEMDPIYDVDPHGQVFVEDGNYHPYPLGSKEMPIRGSGHHRGQRSR